MTELVLQKELTEELKEQGIDYTKEYLSQSSSVETVGFVEDSVSIKMVSTNINNVISSINIYEDGEFKETINVMSAEDCTKTGTEAVTKTNRAYENRKFTKYKRQYTETGNTEIDHINKKTIIRVLSGIGIFADVGIGFITNTAAALVNRYLDLGYRKTDTVNMDYTVRKYWSHTKDGIDPVIYRTRFKTVFSNGVKKNKTLYTYNNPI